MSEVSRIIGEQIKKYRKRKKINQKELAALFSVTPSAVSGWEAGSFTPSSDMMVQLCEYFGVTLDELFGREKKPVDDGLREVDNELFKSLNDAGQDEALRRLRLMITEAVADELDRRGRT